MSRDATAAGSPDVSSDATPLATDRTTDGPSVLMVATPGDGSCGIGTYADTLQSAGEALRTETLEIPQDERTVPNFLSLAVRAATAEYDVVHVQHEYGLFRRDGSRYPGVMGLVFFPVLALLAAVTGTRIVVTMHSVLSPSPSEAPFRVRLYLLVMHRLLVAVADHLVFLAPECAARFREDVLLPPDRYDVLPHGVNTLDAATVSTADARAAFGFDPEDTVVLIPGFIRPPKGHDVFVEVARRLPEYEFFVAGGARPKGEDADFAERIAAEAPSNVTISGVLDDGRFPVALSAADLAFLPYRVVTQSGTFNWCAAQELAVLSSDVPYFERMRREWGNVETVDVDDVDAVVDRIRTLLDSPDRLDTLRANMRRFRAANDLRRVARVHRGIYEAVVGNGEADSELSAPERVDAGLLAGCSANREDPASST